MPAPQNGSAHESTPLLNGNNNNNAAAVSRSNTEDRYAHLPGWKKAIFKVKDVTWATLASNYVNALLVFVPIGMVAGAMGWNPTAVFILNFIAIVPLAALLSFATEEVSAELGQTLGGLMNATFGNAVELIVSVLRCLNAMRRDGKLTNGSRCRLSPSSEMKSVSCRPACWVASCPTFFL